MKISVVTISYNQSEFLEKAIESIVNQDYENVEYIVVDPGSTDGSREIIMKYESQIDTIIFEPDNGPADGLNKGFSHATGDVLAYINADDILLPQSLTRVAAHFKRNFQIDVLLGNGVEIDSHGAIIRPLFCSPWDVVRYVYGACAIVQQGNFFRKSAFDRTEGFNTRNRTCWDGELLVDLSISGAVFVKVNDFLGGFRRHSGSTSRVGELKRKYKLDRERIFNKVMGRNKQPFDLLKSYHYRLERKLASVDQQFSTETSSIK